MGKKNAVKMEARETILADNKVIVQTITQDNKTQIKPLTFKAKPNKTPKVVATPFPPLKFKNTGQLCPIIAKTPKINLKISG